MKNSSRAQYGAARVRHDSSQSQHYSICWTFHQVKLCDLCLWLSADFPLGSSNNKHLFPFPCRKKGEGVIFLRVVRKTYNPSSKYWRHCPRDEMKGRTTNVDFKTNKTIIDKIVIPVYMQHYTHEVDYKLLQRNCLIFTNCQ